MSEQYIKFGSVKKDGNFSKLLARAVGKLESLSGTKRKDEVVKALELFEILDELKITDSLYGIWLTHNTLAQVDAQQGREAMLLDFCDLIQRSIGKPNRDYRVTSAAARRDVDLESSSSNPVPVKEAEPDAAVPEPPAPKPVVPRVPEPPKQEAIAAPKQAVNKPTGGIGGMMKLS